MNRDLELLSAYVDGEVSEKERLEIEQKIMLSPELQHELLKLQKLKKLTLSSSKKLDDSPYFETRLMAKLSTESGPVSKVKKWLPVAGFSALAIFLMIFLKFHPDAITEIVEEQKTNLAGFYKENLKPLLFASDLTNEDIFNFAFYHQLPLDKDDNQVLQLGYSDSGGEFFEIKDAGMTPENNYENFISALNLTSVEREKMDSILESYKDEIQMQVLANENNTVAINPNLWNYNKAIAADLIAFAKDANRVELAKIIPPNIPLYSGSVHRIIDDVKSGSPSQYIFLTPDTIFSEEYTFDWKEMEKDLAKTKSELKGTGRELKDNRTVLASLRGNLEKLRNDSSWNKNFSVNYDTDAYRVNIAQVEIPEIIIPDFNELTENIEQAVKHVQAFTVAFPRIPKVNGNMHIEFGGDSSIYNFNFRIPNLDSITHFVPQKVDSLMRGYSKNFNMRGDFNLNLDSLVSSFNYNFSDSIYHFQSQEFMEQMKELKKEMERFRNEMQNMQKDLRKDSVKVQKKKSIVI